MKNRKGIMPLAVAGIILLVALALYLVLFIPVPAFTALRQTVNYFFVLLLWILFQFALFYGAYKLIQYLILGYNTYKFKIVGWVMKVKRYIISH